MAVGIHKPGQGYWVRVLTACYLGVIVLAAAAWCASQAKLVLDNIPKSTFEVTVSAPTGSLAPGQIVTVFTPASASGDALIPVGTARVVEFDSVNRRLKLNQVTPAAGPDAPMEWDRGTRIEVPGAAPGAPAAFSSTFNGRAAGVAAIEPVILQGIVAGVVIILGAALTFLFVAWKPRTVDFLIATDMEMRKVNWSTRRDVIASTWVVILASVLLAVGLFIVDMGFKTFFQEIGILVK